MANLPAGWSVNAANTSFVTKDTATVFSGDASVKYTFGAGGTAGAFQGITTNDPVKGADSLPLRPGLSYRVTVASRVSSITGAPSFRVRMSYNVADTLNAAQVFTYATATTWQNYETTFTVPAAAEANSSISVEFARGNTTAHDFWADAVRVEEGGVVSVTSGQVTQPSLAPDVVKQVSEIGVNMAVNGDVENGMNSWRVASASGVAHTMQKTSSSPIENTYSMLITIGDAGTTSRVQQCDRQTDVDDSTGGSPLYLPVQPFDEVWATCKVNIGLLSAAFLLRVEEYDSAKSLIQRTTLASKTNISTVATFQVYGGAVLSSTTRYVVLVAEYPGSFTDKNGTFKIDAVGLYRIPAKQRCHVYRSAAKTITTATPTAIDWDTEGYDVGAMHDTVTNNTRVTVNGAASGRGTIRLLTQVQWAAGVTGYRQLQVRKNGATVLGEDTRGGTVTIVTTQQCAAVDNAPAAGDYYEVIVTHTQGANLNVNNGQWVSYFQAKHEDG